MLKLYMKKLFDSSISGDAREESYYSILENLLYTFADSIGSKNNKITTLPKKTEAGNPDFRVWDGKQKIIGYIEAKSPETEDLDLIEDSEQLQCYIKTFPNLILTNFFQFRLYREGNLIDKVSIARPFVLRMLRTIPPVGKEKEFKNLLEKFFSFSFPKITSAQNLAVELAKRTRFLKDEIIAEELKGDKRIIGFYEAFKAYLIHNLTHEDFADHYSQTVAYGLFASRMRSENEFNRKQAFENIPHTIGIMRELFNFISLGDVPTQMEWIIDDISEVLASADVKNILLHYFCEGKGKDPVLHFYETFLAAYDPKTRERRGVYYTPEPVVSFIVRSLNSILKEKFYKPDGFANEGVTVLDPAAGTLTFIVDAAKLAVDEFVSKYGEGGKKEFFKKHILENFYSLELMMAPYAVGHLKMSFLLEELGYRLNENDRVKLYLANTLEMEDLEHTSIPGLSSLSEESHLAGMIKKEKPILVIMGNPPYSGISSNKGEWITRQIEDYKFVDGKHFNEKKHWLQDDYVKFIKFAQWKIDRAGEGILGFITNHSYLDNPTFRGMRQSLMNSFNEIYILDLHGNSLKKEKCPDGSKDENVFDIRQGTAIALFVKKKGENEKCNVCHSEMWGLREKKYKSLLKNNIETVKWQKLSPKSEFYFFVPWDEKLSRTYNKFVKIIDIFPVNSVGIVTSRDKFVIDNDKKELVNRIQRFKNSTFSDEDLHTYFNINKKKGWNIRLALNVLKNLSDFELNKHIKQILYRPFDKKWIFYHDSVVCRSLKRVMCHMFQNNMGLLTSRQMDKSLIEPVFVTNSIIDAHSITSAVSISYIFPLYLYPNIPKDDLLNNIGSKEKQPNIKPEIFHFLTESYTNEPAPEDIFYYIYAVLYSNIYRTEYAEFLKFDFPRVPFTKDNELFRMMGVLGKKLVNLHLLKSPDLDKPVAQFPVEGDNKIEKITYNEKYFFVYINKNQYFKGITEEAWHYHIGGYQVCSKWLKDRKKRALYLDDIKHYCNIVTTIHKTIEIQRKIDSIYPEIEKDIIEFDE